MLGHVNPKNVYIGSINKALSFTTYNELGREISYEDRETDGCSKIINVKKVCDDAILIKIDEVFYIRVEPANNLKGYRNTILPTFPTNEGDLFVDQQSLRPFTFSNPTETKSVKIKELVRKEV